MKISLFFITVLVFGFLVFPLRIFAYIVFKDIPEGTKYYEDTKYLQNRGIISGFPDGTYQPLKTLNRAEACILLLRGAGIMYEQIYSRPFPDVAPDAWYGPCVMKAKSLGIVQGYKDGTYRPTQEVRVAEAIKMWIKAKKLTMSDNYRSTGYEDQWWAPYIATAHEGNFFSIPNPLSTTANEVNWSSFITRGQMAQLVFRTLYLVEDTRLSEFEFTAEGSTKDFPVYENMRLGFKVSLPQDWQGYWVTQGVKMNNNYIVFHLPSIVMKKGLFDRGDFPALTIRRISKTQKIPANAGNKIKETISYFFYGSFSETIPSDWQGKTVKFDITNAFETL